MSSKKWDIFCELFAIWLFVFFADAAQRSHIDTADATVGVWHYYVEPQPLHPPKYCATQVYPKVYHLGKWFLNVAATVSCELEGSCITGGANLSPK